MPRLATLLRPLRMFGSDPAANESCSQPGKPLQCPYCRRILKSDGDFSRHLTLRASCRREEERAARAQAPSEMDVWSILEALGQAQMQLEAKERSERSEVGADVPEANTLEAEAEVEVEVEAEARATGMEVEGLGEPVPRPGPTAPSESPPISQAEPNVEPRVPPPSEVHEASPLADTMPGLVFDGKQGNYVERFPDPRAGAPINDKTACAPDLDAYMADKGNLGNPWHFDTLELLMTTGLTASGRDQHLKSHLYMGNTPWKSNKMLMEDLDKLPHGTGWKIHELNTKVNEKSTKTSYLFTRHIVEVTCEIMANPAFEKYMHFTPERRYKTADRRNRIYGNPWTAKWWWRTQMRIPDKSATIVPLIIASDRTRLSTMAGGQEAYPLYLSVGNIEKSVRRRTTSKATALLAYLPVEEFENAVDTDEKARLKNELTHRAMEKVTEPLRTASKDGVEMLCADGRFRRGYPIVAGVVGDWPEQCMMGCVAEGGCPKCIQKGKGRGDYRQHARPRTNAETLEALRKYRENGDLGELEELGLKPWWPWWADLPYVDFAACLMPDLLHQLHQGMVKTHVVRWVRELVGKRRVDQCFASMPRAEGMRHFDKGVSRLKGQWTGRESREVAKQLLPIAAGQRSTKLDPDLTGLTRAVLEFSYRASASQMTEEDLDQLEKSLEEVHHFKNVLIREGLFEDDSRFDRIPKLHMLSHYVEAIREMGTPDNYSTETPEHLHIECAKRGWRASNKVRPTPQMVKFVQRYEALRIHRAHMDRWLGVTEEAANRRRRGRKSRVVLDEEVEAIQASEGTGMAEVEGETECNIEAEEKERLEEEDEAAEGPKVQLEGRRRMGPDANQHVVYLDPALSIAVQPSAGRVSGADIVGKYGALNFVRSLHTYLKKHTTRKHLPSFFLPTAHHYFLVWHRLYLHHRPLPFDPEHAKRDVVRARPESPLLHGAFDVALLVHHESEFGIHPRGPFHGMNTTSHALTPEGQRRTAVVSIYDVVASCHLAPQFRRLDPDVQLRISANVSVIEASGGDSPSKRTHGHLLCATRLDLSRAAQSISTDTLGMDLATLQDPPSAMDLIFYQFRIRHGSLARPPSHPPQTKTPAFNLSIHHIR
ncbi:hypothetical protein FRC10_007286 [Ceratobasidium sp. 414]|nr:hypothetical protein FRC10_007286 [Ceratobasidium sp. 414]